MAHAWLDGMGFTNNQFIVSRHTDTEHPHIHILANRISLDGSVVSDSHDYKRQEVIMSEQEILEMRLALLNQQEAQKLQNNAELMKTLQDLNKSIKEAIKEVQQSANAVRTYPVEVISKGATRMEQCLLQCEQSAKKASVAYDNATELIKDYENSLTKNILFGVLASSIFASLMTGLIVIWRLKG